MEVIPWNLFTAIARKGAPLYGNGLLENAARASEEFTPTWNIYKKTFQSTGPKVIHKADKLQAQGLRKDLLVWG